MSETLKLWYEKEDLNIGKFKPLMIKIRSTTTIFQRYFQAKNNSYLCSWSLLCNACFQFHHTFLLWYSHVNIVKISFLWKKQTSVEFLLPYDQMFCQVLTSARFAFQKTMYQLLCLPGGENQNLAFKIKKLNSIKLLQIKSTQIKLQTIPILFF